MNNPVLAEPIEKRILFLRGHKVMLSTDLAELYQVEPRTLIQAVKRKRKRFPGDFMFQLTAKELRSLRSQIVILEKGRGKYPKYPPYAFTEQGVAMLSSVLNSERAIQVNIVIMRAFVKLKQLLTVHRTFARKLVELEHKLEGHDQEIQSLFEAIRQLMAPPKQSKRRIGFYND